MNSRAMSSGTNYIQRSLRQFVFCVFSRTTTDTINHGNNHFSLLLMFGHLTS
jgi:hypothetical protein